MTKKYYGGRHIEIHEKGNPDNAMKRMQRWLKEENFFMEIREREAYIKRSEKNRKKKHLAKRRQSKLWRDLEKDFGPVKTKRTRNKSNRGKNTSSRDVKKPNDNG